MKYTIEELQHLPEGQTFDRKSFQIEPKALAIPIVAMANADGGVIAIGISDKQRKIEGINQDPAHLNELLRTPFDFCVPTVSVTTEYISCTDCNGNQNRILLIHVPASPKLHANQADEVFWRVGDKSRKLGFDERLQLMYDKGERYYEDSPAYDATLDDIDMEAVKAYTQRIGYGKSAMEYLQEMAVNSCCHRDYSIKGTEIQVKMFDDRLVFETPGKLPGVVRPENIRHTHFSRNPKIAEYLKAYDYVKEFGEGVDRMCRELAATGIPDPRYQAVSFIMKATVYATPIEGQEKGQEKGRENIDLHIISAIQRNPTISISALSLECNKSPKATRNALDRLRANGIVKRVGPDKGGRWEIVGE